MESWVIVVVLSERRQRNGRGGGMCGAGVGKGEAYSCSSIKTHLPSCCKKQFGMVLSIHIYIVITTSIH